NSITYITNNILNNNYINNIFNNCYNMIHATMMIIMAEILFNTMMYLPVLSTCPTNLPAIAKNINQIHEIVTVATVNNTLSEPSYNAALVPITPIVSIIACGFNNDTDIANPICFRAVIE